jgi:broad specificity phosphatase PhoE
MRSLLLPVLLLCACVSRPHSSAAADQAAPRAGTVVLLVRHAERASQAANSNLSAAGIARAQALADSARAAGAAAIMVTDYCRTAQTGDVIAGALQLPLEIMKTGGSGAGLTGCNPPLTARTSEFAIPAAQGIAERIRTAHAGRVVLVIGHGNTVPEIARALGAPLCPRFLQPAANGQCLIPEPDYHHLFLVRVAADGSASVEQKAYGPIRQ